MAFISQDLSWNTILTRSAWEFHLDRKANPRAAVLQTNMLATALARLPSSTSVSLEKSENLCLHSPWRDRVQRYILCLHSHWRGRVQRYTLCLHSHWPDQVQRCTLCLHSHWHDQVQRYKQAVCYDKVIYFILRTKTKTGESFDVLMCWAHRASPILL